LAAGFRPDPLVELKRSPDPLAAIRGLLLKGGKGRGKGVEGKEREGKKGGAPHMTCLYDAPVAIALQVYVLLNTARAVMDREGSSEG